MGMKLRKKRGIFVILSALLCAYLYMQCNPFSSAAPADFVAGGTVHQAFRPAVTTLANPQTIEERFTRPSKQQAYPNANSFQTYYHQDNKPPLIEKTFDTPYDVILAYYGILQNASNMKEHTGGCGSLLYGTEPYPYAYALLTKETQAKLSLKQFIDSYQGIGNLTLLNLEPAAPPRNTSSNFDYFMVEIEVITGPKVQDNPNRSIGSYFAYYYGIVTTEKTAGGYRIQKIDYLPEDFLCAPVHGWDYDANYILSIVYMENLSIVETIDDRKQEGSRITIFASGHDKHYKFEFIRLTNGYDILLHESILKNGVYKETDLLGSNWKYLKLSADSPRFGGAPVLSDSRSRGESDE